MAGLRYGGGLHVYRYCLGEIVVDGRNFLRAGDEVLAAGEVPQLHPLERLVAQNVDRGRIARVVLREFLNLPG